MYLKTLHMVGFKSFADKTALHFDRGVTAVVGPNGCGKSNVLDAIRWVLGEQSAKALRGGNMQDVIFGGTDSRKPLSMAEVSLTFADCEGQLGVEFHEVTITRRVFRDGQSEYEMNKTPCRLRDIHQLFMDTGIGRTAYSIMEQGKIDQILSSRPEDRRAIFEEAAGITKFKSQRKEALKKLENTEANLLRLADIIREVKRQIGSLQRQAGKAKRYQELHEELKTSELTLARHKFDAVHGVISALEAQVNNAKAEVEALASELESGELGLSALREQVVVLEAELNDVRERQNAARNAVDRAQQIQEMNRSRVEEFTEMREQALREVAAAEERTRIQEEQLESLTAQLESLQSMRGETESAYEAQREEEHMLAARISGTENDRAEVEDRQAAAAQRLNTLQNNLAALEIQQRNFLFRVETIKSEQAELATRLSDALATRATQEEQRLSAEARAQELKAQLAESTQHLRTLEESAKVAENAVRQQSRARQQKEAEAQALEKLQSTATPSSASAQDLAATTALHGALAEHLRVAPGSENVIARLLGDALQALVVPDTATVESILTQLGTAKSLALLPLQAPRQTIFTTGSAQHALHFVTAAPLAASLVESLLAHSYLTETLSEAHALRREIPHATVATRDGALLSPTGLVRVGVSAGDGAARLARQNRLTELEQEIAAELALEQQAQSAAEAAAQEVTEARASLETQRAHLQEVEVLTATLRQQFQSAQSIVLDLERRHDTTTQELQRLSAQDQADREKKNELASAILSAQQESEATQLRLSELADQLDALADEENTQRQRGTELKVTLATQTQQCEGLQHQREPIANRLAELRDFTETRRRAVGDYEGRIGQALGEIERATLQQAEAFQQATLHAGEASEKLAQKNSVVTQVEETDQQLRSKRRHYSEVQSARGEQEVRLATQKLQIESLRERIQRAYNLALEDLPPLPEYTEENPAPDWDALAAQVEEQRQRIDSMGPVNLEAIAEYDELEQRHTFLTEQETDMVNAKEQLLAAIAEINLTTKVLFAETFEKIKVNFQETFTQLFGGGKGGLILSDESDPLESGIEIVARPPGKQPTSITLLSGGEKTMTAVALLFAIYMVKPSPFCVLDEMDAPLDESNIGRFIKMLNRFVQQSQFVVITHNKKTISAADVVFGVTMEEHGVSKLVSVKFAKPAEKPATQLEIAVDPVIPSVAETFGKMVEVRV